MVVCKSLISTALQLSRLFQTDVGYFHCIAWCFFAVFFNACAVCLNSSHFLNYVVFDIELNRDRLLEIVVVKSHPQSDDIPDRAACETPFSREKIVQGLCGA